VDKRWSLARSKMTTDRYLFPQVIERLKNKGIIESSADLEPSAFLGNGANNGDASKPVIRSQFWQEAHTLSCLKHASFHSSLEQTLNDVIPKDSNGDAEDLVEMFVEKCALTHPSGKITNSEKKRFRTVICNDSYQHLGSTPQLETLGTLSSEQLSTRQALSTKNATYNTAESIPAREQQSWMKYVTSPVKKISAGISYAIDSVLGDDYSSRLYAQTADVGTSNLELDDQNALPTQMLQVDEDDAFISKTKGVYQQPLGVKDELFSIDAITMTCRHLLDYATKAIQDDDEEIFTVHDASGHRIIMQVNGSRGSMGAFCNAGKYHMTTNTENKADVESDSIQRYIANLLSNVSEEHTNVITQTLLKSRHIVLTDEYIILFPNGVPSNYSSCKSDQALFQIHNTRLSIQHRMSSLEMTANNSKSSAISANRDGMQKSALMHMRRRRVALEEIGRCSLLLSNLDAAELRLQRAHDDAALVQTFSLLKTTLADIRTSSGVDKEDVEELMLDIKEEMENDIGSTLGSTVFEVDEDELNAEMRLLELDCLKDQLEDKVVKESIEANEKHEGVVQEEAGQSFDSVQKNSMKGVEHVEKANSPQKVSVPV
jgi:hypothetical protein